MKVSEIKIGETYNGVKVLERVRKDNGRGFAYECLCPVCGKTHIINARGIGVRKSCAKCYAKSKFKDLTGLTFGGITVLRHLGFIDKRTKWECVCSCGKHFEASTSNILRGKHQSCGCEQTRLSQRKRRHSVTENFGDTPVISHPLWRIWYGIKMRCYNPNEPSFKNYGGRGIKMCERWRADGGFENFINDMGTRPSMSHTIDRIDVNGDYCPENCRWATKREQLNNTRRNLFLQVNGDRISVSQFYREYKTIYGLRGLYQLIHKGYDINFILTIPDTRSLLSRKFREEAKKHINHNRVVSDEVIKLLEQHKPTINSNETSL